MLPVAMKLSCIILFADNEIWICKPTGRNQGKGIFLVRNLDELNRNIAESDEANQQNQQQGRPQKPMNRIIQRYSIFHEELKILRVMACSEFDCNTKLRPHKAE